MSRTNPVLVKAIIGVDSAIEITPFIDTANSLTDKVAAADVDSELSAKDKELIERWLAAHFYAHRDQLLTSKSEGRASGSFQGQTAMHLESTQYGQTAMILDTTGYLNNLNLEAKTGMKNKTQLWWLGTPKEAL